jgi:hypothetical protein
LPVHINLSATNAVQVEQVELKVAGKTAPSSWRSDRLDVGVTTYDLVHFSLPDGLNEGQQTAQVIVYADNKTWASNSFPVLITSEQVQLKSE